MTKIFVGNLPHELNEAELRRRFEQYGRVAMVEIMVDPVTHRSRGFGFVRMPRLDDADEAIRSMSGAVIKGRRLTVNEARARPGSASRNGAATGTASERKLALDLFAALRDCPDDTPSGS